MGTGKTYSTKYIIDNDGNTGVAGQILTSTDQGINFQDAVKDGPSQIKGSLFDSKVVLIDTPNGGLKPYRVITDEYGEWIQVGRFAANARTTIQGTWSSVSGLSTGIAQSETTQFSADFGDSFPTEVRVMGATDFNNWRNTRTIDWVYKVPEGRKWKYFFSNGAETGMTPKVPLVGGASTRFGWKVNGAYDGFGRWTNADLVHIGMSDSEVTNPAAAYSAATSNAFNWDAGSDAKLTVNAYTTYSGQDQGTTSAVGSDDSNNVFYDTYPTQTNNGTGGTEFSSAVWILIKLPGSIDGTKGGYWTANGNDIYNTNAGDVTVSANVGIGATTPDAKLEVGGGATGIILSNLGDSSAYDAIRMTYTGYNSGTPEFIFQPKTAPGSGTANTYFRFKTQGSSGLNVANVTVDGKIGIGNQTPQAPLSLETVVGPKIDFYHNTTSSDRYGIEVQSSELRIHSGAQGAATGGITFGKKTTSTFTEAMRIRNNGNVGIGTSTPFEETTGNTGLNVDTGGHSSIQIGDGINDGGIIQSSDNSQRIIIGANVYDSPTDSWTRWNATGAALVDVYGEADNAFISLNVDDGTTGFPPARLFVDGTGKIGIGTTAPATLLHVHGGTGGASIIVRGDQPAGSYYYGYMYDGTNLKGTTQTNIFYAGATIAANTTIAEYAAFRIDSPNVTASNAVITHNYGIYQASSLQKNYFGGSVGIGSTSPSKKLNVEGSVQLGRNGNNTGGDPNITLISGHGIEDASTGNYYGSYGFLEFNANTNYTGSARRFALTNGFLANKFAILRSDTNMATMELTTGGAEPTGAVADFVIDTSGKIGIGTTSPDRKLHVNSGTTNVVARFESTDTIAAIEFKDNNGSAEIGNTGDSLVFFPAGAEKMRIANNGKVGIGAPGPFANLDISNAAGGIYQQWSYDNPGANNYNLQLSETVTSGNVRFVFDQKNAGTTYSDVLVFNKGEIGIGTDEPDGALTISKTTSGISNLLVLTNHQYGSSDNTGSSIRFQGYNLFNPGSSNPRYSEIIGVNGGNSSPKRMDFKFTSDATITTPLSVLQTNKVGIGTTDPSFQMSIANHATTTSTATLELDGKRTDGTDGPVGEMIFSNNGDTFATVAGFRDVADNKGSLQFQTQDSTFATRMTISSEGNVGIGQTNPADGKLQVQDSSSGWMGYFYNTSTSGVGAHIETNSGGTQQVLRVSSVFGGGNNAGFRILANGNAYFGRNSSAPSQELVSTATPTNFGTYTSEIRLIKTPNGGLQKCRVITDNYGEWVLVGRFAASAMTSVQGIWSSVSGLSTATAQNTTTEFSADFGDSYPTEVRIMGATDFTKWRDTRTVDFVYGVPELRKWKNFFSGGADNGMALVGPNHSGNNKYGWGINGSYDGFGRWINPIQTSVGMSDGNVTNPSAAYTTATSNAFNWEGAADAKITVSATRTNSGQDSFETAGFGNDDNIQGFFDEYPSETNNMQGGLDFSSAVWVLIKLPETDSGGIQGPYLPLTAGSTYQLSGELFINAGAGVNIQGTSTDLFFLQGKRIGNSGPTFTVYDNASTAYLNSYQSMTFRANQHGGSGGNFGFFGGSVGINATNMVGKLCVGGDVYIEGGGNAWDTATPGPGRGSIHFDPGTATDHTGNAITFGASDTGSGSTAQAGIYIRSDGTYGTKMYFATTNSYAAGSQTGMILDHNGVLRVKSDIIAYGTSDSRFKDNLVKIDRPLDKINKLSGYYFNWNNKQDIYDVGIKDIGIVAQEVEEVIPEIVETRENGYKAVKYEKIVALLIEGIKEQQQTIEKLEDRLKKLENK